MGKIDVKLWIKYHNHPKSHYTDDELRIIRKTDVFICFLVPTNLLEKRINLEEVRNCSPLKKFNLLSRESEYFGVPPEVISIKIDELLNENINEIKKEKKEGKIRTLINKIKKH